jgi:hypothetical protein
VLITPCPAKPKTCLRNAEKCMADLNGGWWSSDVLLILWEEGLEVRLVHRKLCRNGLDLLIPIKTGTIFDHINQEKDKRKVTLAKNRARFMTYEKFKFRFVDDSSA